MTSTERTTVIRRRRTLAAIIAAKYRDEAPEVLWSECISHAPIPAGGSCSDCGWTFSAVEPEPSVLSQTLAWNSTSLMSLADVTEAAMTRILKVSGVGEGLAGYPSQVQS